MARVVQQRSSPPYLLILFVFLFLVATAIAVVVYLNADQSKKDLAQAQDTLKKVGLKELDSPPVRKMLDNYDKALGGGKGPAVPVLGQYQERVNRLTQLITGDERSPNPEAVAEEAYAVLPTRPGLAIAVLDAHKSNGKIAETEKRVKDAEAEIAKLQADLAAKGKQLDAAAKTAADQLKDFNDKVADLDKKLTEAKGAYDKALADLQTEKQREVDGLNKTISSQADRVIVLEKKLRDLEAEVARLHGPGGSDANQVVAVMRRPNGKVIRVADTQTVYIDLGTQQHVKPGLTFTVYSAKGIPQDPNQYKGKIVVTTPFDTFSACRVTQSDAQNPIMPEDLILNVVYDPERTYRFVVEGIFDLYGTARQGAQGTDEVKALIRRFGGTVSDQVDNDTDYLVLGARPSLPAKPGEEQPPQVKAAWEDIQKMQVRYDSAQKAAQERRIRILNANEFVNLTGYEPAQTAGR